MSSRLLTIAHQMCLSKYLVAAYIAPGYMETWASSRSGSDKEANPRPLLTQWTEDWSSSTSTSPAAWSVRHVFTSNARRHPCSRLDDLHSTTSTISSLPPTIP